MSRLIELLQSRKDQSFDGECHLTNDEADAIRGQLEAMQAEIERLRAEIARLRNIMNEDGLHDPELAKLAGKHRDVLEASTDKGGRKFRASLDKEGEK